MKIASFGRLLRIAWVFHSTVQQSRDPSSNVLFKSDSQSELGLKACPLTSRIFDNLLIEFNVIWWLDGGNTPYCDSLE